MSTDISKAFTDFWAAQAQAMLRVQDQAGKAIAEGMQAVASGAMPQMPGGIGDLSSGAAEMANASKAVMELWSAATAMSGTLATSLPQLAGAAGGDTTVEDTLRRMIDPRSWLSGSGEMDDVLGRMAEGPRFADLWEAERLYARVLQAWMTVRRRGLEHNAIMLEAWLQAGRRFTEEWAGRTSAGGQPDGKAAMALWTETANRQLLETQHAQPFLQSQTAMIRASTELRIAQQELVEHFGRKYGFPTRVELDDVHRSVTELRREVRLLRREQRQAAAAPAPAGGAEAELQATPARRPGKPRGTQ